MRDRTILPEIMLGDLTLSPAAKLLYAAMQIYGTHSVGDLARLSSLGPSTVRRSCKQLEAQGWIVKVKQGRIYVPTPSIPHVIQEQMVKDLHAGYAVSQLKGEFLSKSWSGHLIQSDEYVDNGRHPFLQHPATGECLELDRYYELLKLGFEFHGPQHFGPTNAFPSVQDYKELRTRDLVKRALCEEHGITLVVVTAEDLTLPKMLDLLPKDIPLRTPDVKGPYVTSLEALSQEYRVRLARAISRENRQNREGR